MSRFLILIIKDTTIFTKNKIISASRALREFVGTLEFGEKGQLTKEPTVVYLRQIQE